MASVIPVLRYRDASKAIDWLVDVFGFTRHLEVEDDAGQIIHAQLVLDGEMIMLGTKTSTSDGGGSDPDGIYVVVANVDAHAERARSHGAEIRQEPQDEDYGGRGYTLADLEGKVWSVGSYDPWASEQT